MEWEEALIEAKHELGYYDNEYISNYDEVVEYAKLFLKEVRDRERDDNYMDYMNSELWQKTREQVFKRDNYMCIDCNIKKATDCHHVDYTFFSHGDEYEIMDCVSLCDFCHKSRHGNTPKEFIIKEKKAKVIYDSKKERKNKKIKKPEEKNEKYKQLNIKKYIYFKCPNCNEQEVEHKDEWCDDCNLPERNGRCYE